jgi:DNA-binding PadR family transcriptional regulator
MADRADREDVVQGTLDFLVLRIIAAQPMYGGASGSWDVSENTRKARYYTITKTGQKQLARERQHWKSVATAVEKVLEGA